MSDGNKLAPCLMVQGTCSSAGKSMVVTALCRYFNKLGYKVAPFKSQNMSLNSVVTPEGDEIGTAQGVQAEAAGIEPHVDMNPILLKPEGHRKSQVVVLGAPIGRMSAVEYHRKKVELKPVIIESLERLRTNNDIVIIEGAGSPAEINLKAHDIVNMYVAGLADAAVLLVGDIDRGGVFASLVGTIELLTPEERERVAGFVINKFRGDPTLLSPGFDFLLERTGIPVLGVLPWLENLGLADEDSTGLEKRLYEQKKRQQTKSHHQAHLFIEVVRFPHLSNYDEFLLLEDQPNVTLSFVSDPEKSKNPDLLILPGSKSTISDLGWFLESGWKDVLEAYLAQEGRVLGICGGCQMLGRWIDDEAAYESDGDSIPGLGFLDLYTKFHQTKTTAKVEGSFLQDCFLGRAGSAFSGYEIHMGTPFETKSITEKSSYMKITTRNHQLVNVLDGAGEGRVFGTMIHGLLKDPEICSFLLKFLGGEVDEFKDRTQQTYDRLADSIASSLDGEALHRMVGIKGPLATD
ncbi:MAG: cobyric acid synthase CobQ [Zetaproteobacteria bacterium]|nr:cobyric acid synthase CobQ [Pseudobdellovibrionaceae bacterium]